MLKKLLTCRGDLFLWLYCLVLGLAGVAWAVDVGLRVDERLPSAIAHLFSAQSLARGEWLGPFRSVALSVRPGYTFWIAFNYLLGVPLILGSFLLLTFSAVVFVAAMRKMGLPRILSGIAFTVLLVHPVIRDIYDGVTPVTLTLPLILLAASCYFFSIFQEKSGRKIALWICSGVFLALYWVSLADPWLPVFMAGWFTVWELWLQPPNHSLVQRLRWVLPLLLAMIVPAALADLGIRGINQARYHQFALKKVSRWGGESSRVKGQIPPASELAAKVGGYLRHDPRRQYLEIAGWATLQGVEIKKIQLLDESGQPVGETANFLDRPDVKSYLQDQVGWKEVPLKTGFLIETKVNPGSKESLRLSFLGADGKPVRNLGLDVLGDAGPAFSFYLDSIRWKDPGQGVWRTAFSGIDPVFADGLPLLFPLAVFCAVLFALAKFGGAGAKADDFWLVLFSGLIAILLYQSVQENYLHFDAFSRRAWPLTPVFVFLTILLSWRVGKIFADEWSHLAGVAAWWGSVRPERVFLVLALVFGAFFVFFNPPFQAPDEAAHSYRTFQTSQGESAQVFIPRSVIRLTENYRHLSFHPESKVTFREILDDLKVPLKPEEKGFAGSIGVSFIPYIAPAFGIFLGRLVGLPPLALIYLGRLFSLLAFTALIFVALRRLPFFKWVFFALALGPMALYEASSLSHDPFTVGISFLLTATLLARAYGPEERISKLQIAEFILLGTLASLAKAVYFPLVFLYFWIPVRKMGSWQRYLLVFALLLGISFGTDLLWNLQSGAVKWATRIGGEPTKPVRGSFSFIVQNPWHFLSLVGATLKTNHRFYLESFLGRLGWLDTAIPLGTRFLYGSTLLLLAFCDRVENVYFGYRQKILSAAVFAAVCFGLFITFFIAWTKLSDPYIDGIQGRYFIPVVPLFLLIFYRNRPRSWVNRAIPLWATLAMAMVLSVCGMAMLNRYYYI